MIDPRYKLLDCKTIQALRAKSDLAKTSSVATEGNEAGKETEPAIRFKNYKPYDSSLVVKVVEKSSEIVENNDAPVESKKEETDIIKRELAQYNEEELNIVPKKANWDLKSQIEGRMNKLKRKTQRAIVDILREKLAEKSDDEDDNNEIGDS